MRRRTAYTLLELMLVLAIIVVVAAVSFPAVTSMYSGVRLKGASDGVRTAWANARTWAIDDARPYRFAVIPGKGNFRVAPDTPDFWGGGSTEGLGGNVMEDSLPRGIIFTDDAAGASDDGNTVADTSSGAADWVHVITFLPDGTAEEDAQVALAYGAGKPLVLKLRGLTGAMVSGRSADR